MSERVATRKRTRSPTSRKREKRGETIRDMTTVSVGMLLFDGLDNLLLVLGVERAMKGFADVRAVIMFEHAAGFSSQYCWPQLMTGEWQLVSDV